MRIGILGAGMIGSTVAKLCVRAGHEIMLANLRGPQSLEPVIQELESTNARAGTPQSTAAFGDLVILAIPWRNRDGWPRDEWVAGKIVIDAMNPYGEEGEVLHRNSSEEVRRALPSARLVKAFNTMYFKQLASLGNANANLEDRYALFVAGDDAEAKAEVARLIDGIGFGAVDTGSLAEGGLLQMPGSPLYNRPMTVAAAKALVRSAGKVK